MSAAAAIRTAQADQLGDQIIAAGFAPNGFVLDINGALDVPRDFPLSAPWNLPSRLFQFPIEVIRAEQDEPRKIGLRPPLQIGRASCRGVVGQYVSILVVSGSVKKKKITNR